MNITTYHPFRSPKAKETYLTRYVEMAKEWPIPANEQLVDTAYGQTFVRISGPPDAPPLVLLPGAGTCSLQWLLNIEALSQNHRTHAVDALINVGGVGKSVPTRAITSPNDAVTWLDELFNGLGLGESINLLGASYGGWSASQYALHRQDRLNKLVLVAPAGMVLPFHGTYMWRTILLNVIPRRNMYLRFFKWSFKDLAKQNSQFLEEMADDFMMSSQCFESVNPKELPSLAALTDEELQQLKLPTLFLVGENEVLYSADKALQRLHEVAPHIQTELIPNAGHDLLLVQTEMVNRKIVEFLAKS
jgi:pimeloyl-ACP methyl ester carboxylesterase